MDRARFADDHVLAVAARATAVGCAIAIVMASLGPTSWLPHLFYSNNLEHFAAFYFVALAFYAARYRTPLLKVLRDVALLASVLEAAKWVLPGPRPANFQHWIADLGGILAAVAPLQIQAFRSRFDRNPADSDAV
jgi:hypothetical protein